MIFNVSHCSSTRQAAEALSADRLRRGGVSREVAEAIRWHVMLEQFSSESPAGAADPRAARPPHSGQGEQ
jgi:hypothetical protein